MRHFLAFDFPKFADLEKSNILSLNNE